MKLAFFYFVFASIVFMQFCKDYAEAKGVTCGLDGVCRDSDKNGEGTVCSNCYSCTFKNCCNKVYSSPYAKCTIDGWRKKGYVGNVPVVIGAPRKRDVGCSKTNHCAGDGYKCVAYKKGDDKGFCWKVPQGEAGNSSFALAVAIAFLVILV